MPERKRTTKIGVYPRVFGFPFTLGFIFIGTVIFSAFIAVMIRNVAIGIIPPVICYLIIHRIDKKYGDFYIQKSQITRYGLLKTAMFIARLRQQMQLDKPTRHEK